MTPYRFTQQDIIDRRLALAAQQRIDARRLKRRDDAEFAQLVAQCGEIGHLWLPADVMCTMDGSPAFQCPVCGAERYERQPLALSVRVGEGRLLALVDSQGRSVALEQPGREEGTTPAAPSHRDGGPSCEE